LRLVLAPHNDDETLWTSFTIQREKSNVAVVVVFDSFLQQKRGNPVTADDRRFETRRALLELGCDIAMFAGIPDHHATASDAEAVSDALLLIKPWRPFGDEEIEHVYAPAIEENGHEQHNAVGRAADILWPGQVTHYLTYTYRTETHRGGKSERRLPNGDPDRPVAFTGEMVRRKLRALACYESQIDLERLGCRDHFCRDLWEYYE